MKLTRDNVFHPKTETPLSDAEILSYADMRVLPNGVGTLEDRLSDVRN